MVDIKKLYEIIGRHYVTTLEMSEREDELIQEYEERLKHANAIKDIWFDEYMKAKERAEGLETRILGLEEEEPEMAGDDF